MAAIISTSNKYNFYRYQMAKHKVRSYLDAAAARAKDIMNNRENLLIDDVFENYHKHLIQEMVSYYLSESAHY